MSRAILLPLVGVLIGLFVACEQARPSPLAPSVVTSAPSAVQAQLHPTDRWGAGAMRLTQAAAESTSGFLCALGPFGLAEYSHFTTSASGNETLVCSGMASVPAPERILKLDEFPCVLPSGTVTTDSHFVITPSGHATLTCHAKK